MHKCFFFLSILNAMYSFSLFTYGDEASPKHVVSIHFNKRILSDLLVLFPLSSYILAVYCGRTLSSHLQQGDRHAMFWSSHDHFWGTILASAWREAVWIADLLSQIWIHHLPNMMHMSYHPLFQSPLSCILLSRVQIWQDSSVMQALVWPCMVRFRVILFCTLYANLKQPHIFKHQIYTQKKKTHLAFK